MTNPIRELRRGNRRGGIAAIGTIIATLMGAIGLIVVISVYHEDLWFVWARYRMVRQYVQEKALLEEIPIEDKAVLKAMRRVPRHEFVPDSLRNHAYDDSPLQIGHGQTVSQPYLVAYMTELLKLTPDHRVLEIATGSGYHTAILAEIAGEVYSVEVVEELAAPAEQRLQRLGYTNIHIHVGDGYAGWQEHAPYDAILVRASVATIPPALIEQLKPGGRMVVPVGAFGFQSLILVEKQPNGTITQTDTMPVRFVPLPRYGGPAITPPNVANDEKVKATVPFFHPPLPSPSERRPRAIEEIARPGREHAR